MNSRIKHLSILLFAATIGHLIAYKLIHIPVRLELVVIIAALLFYPIIRRPLIGVYVVFILSPFIPYIRRLYYLVYTRPSIDPLIIISDIFIAFILLGLFFELKEGGKVRSVSKKYIYIILTYFLYLIFRTFVFNILSISEGIARFKYYGPPVLFFLAGIVFADRTEHLKRLWLITIIIGIVATFYGINQLYNGYSEAEKAWFSSIEFTTLFIEGIARPFSIFQAPVAFADYAQLAIIGILVCSLLYVKLQGYILFLFIPIFFYAALITSVRSSWVGIIITFFTWFVILNLKGNRKKFLAVVALLLAYSGFQYAIETFGGGTLSFASGGIAGTTNIDMLVTSRMSALYNPLGEHSFISRINLWKELLIFSKEPVNAILGRGVGALKADSIYFTYLAEFGYPGLIFIIGLFTVFILKGLELIDTSNNQKIIALAKGITVMNIIFAVISITGTHIHYFPGDVYFWFFNGVLIQLYTLNKEYKKDNEEGIKTLS